MECRRCLKQQTANSRYDVESQLLITNKLFIALKSWMKLFRTFYFLNSATTCEICVYCYILLTLLLVQVVFISSLRRNVNPVLKLVKQKTTPNSNGTMPFKFCTNTAWHYLYWQSLDNRRGSNSCFAFYKSFKCLSGSLKHRTLYVKGWKRVIIHSCIHYCCITKWTEKTLEGKIEMEERREQGEWETESISCY